MMGYKMNEKDGLFEIVEKGSELVIAVKRGKDEATKLTRSLNLGSGFDGFTPTFFTLKYPDDPAKGKAAQT